MKKFKIIIPVIAVAIISGFIGISYVLAEKPTGDTPESGATSYIKATYDSIVALGHGSVAAGSWGDWGAYWNRIRSAAEWLPSGNTDPIDVVAGKTYYKDSRTQATGTRQNVASGCPTQLGHDSYTTSTKENTCSYDWPADASVAGAEKVDPVTGLVWSNLLYRNGTAIEFSVLNNTAFSWSNANANNQGLTAPVAGNRTAGQLCSDQGNNWRLPVQKELMQAYIDGAYWNLTQPSYNFWSASLNSSANAWYVYLYSGYTSLTTMTATAQVRCVR